ncbi:MAG: hypothetical protein FJZ90_10070 [Chloroflexi bacterium]|nr:hypothetical protein [Chloroflexota bacterium]
MPISYLERFGYAPAYPSLEHQDAIEAIVDYFAPDSRVQAVILTGSCARGVAALQSCVDISVLVSPDDLAAFRREERSSFERFVHGDPACIALARVVPWSAVDVEFVSGEFGPGPHGWTTGPDNYELELGNTLAWVHPLLQRGSRFEALQAAYLPFYDDAQRAERLREVLLFARNNVDHVVPYAERDLLVQALKRLHHACEEYLQALFIHRRIYPIAYDKWVRQQLVDILGEPALYEEYLWLIAPPALTVRRLHDRCRRLTAFLDELS